MTVVIVNFLSNIFSGVASVEWASPKKLLRDATGLTKTDSEASRYVEQFLIHANLIIREM